MVREDKASRRHYKRGSDPCVLGDLCGFSECVGSAGIGQVPWSAQRIGGWADDGIIAL